MRAPETIRNLGILAHVDAGKTTLSERILFVCGRRHRIGEVHDGEASLDHLAAERARGITISAAATTCSWRGHELHLIDTPGHIDFTAEVERSLRVLDGAVVVLDAVAGVEPQTETVWRQADRHRVPRIVLINKMDRPGANFGAVVAQLHERFGTTAVAVHRPVTEHGRFVGLVDLTTMVEYRWHDGIAPSTSPAQSPDLASARSALVEQVASLDQAALDRWADTATLQPPELRAAIRRACLAGACVPVLCGAAYADIGVQPLLDAVVDLLPSPVDASPTVGTDLDGDADRRIASPSEPFSALVFKVAHPPSGRIAWMRVYSGRVAAGDRVAVAHTGGAERITRMSTIDGGRMIAADHALPGDIVAVAGLKRATTGDTLCEPRHPIVLHGVDVPDTVLRLAVEAATSADQARLAVALDRLIDEDPTASRSVDPETGETLLGGMGELHLDVLVERLRSEHGVEVRVGRPSVAHRQTISRSVLGFSHRLARQTGGAGQFAAVTIELHPTARREVGDVDFESRIVGGAVPREYIHGVERGVRDALVTGPLGPHPVVGLRVVLTDGTTHPKDSSELAFRIAAAQAVGRALESGHPVLLEPVMRVEATVTAASTGAVVAALTQRRGTIVGVESTDRDALLRARVPLAELFGITTLLRSITSGRASVTMTPDGFDARP